MTVMAFKAITPHDFGQQLPGSRALPLSHERYDSASVVVRTQEPTRKRQSDDCLPGLLHVGLKGPRSPVQVRPWRSQTARNRASVSGPCLRTGNREPIPPDGRGGLQFAPGRPGTNANLRSTFPRSHLTISGSPRTGLEYWPAEAAASCRLPWPSGLRRSPESP